MLRPISTSSASASTAPTAVHASGAANLSPHGSRVGTVAETQSASAQSGGGSAQIFRYNSFEFIYRQDIGRIVLIGQSPETGERVVQVPSEQALRAYERTVRIERQERTQQAGGQQKAAQQTTPAPAPQLAKAFAAAVGGDNHGSAVVSVSA